MLKLKPLFVVAGVAALVKLAQTNNRAFDLLHRENETLAKKGCRCWMCDRHLDRMRWPANQRVMSTDLLAENKELKESCICWGCRHG